MHNLIDDAYGHLSNLPQGGLRHPALSGVPRDPLTLPSVKSSSLMNVYGSFPRISLHSRVDKLQSEDLGGCRSLSCYKGILHDTGETGTPLGCFWRLGSEGLKA